MLRTQPPANARNRFSDQSLVAVLSAAVILIIAFFLIRPMLPTAWLAPGSAQLQTCAIIAAILLLVPVGFSLNKRTGAGGAPTRWFIAHVLAATVGMVLAAIHSAARLDGPPALLLLAVGVLAITGVVARVYLSRNMSATFGTKRTAFGAPDKERRAQLHELIERKCAALANLDPVANEATFSITLGHWLRNPIQARAYHQLERAETRLIRARHSVGAGQAWWRPLHVVVGYGLVIGLVVHIVTVTFFAGYVAEGREIYWWHLTAW
jgi:hypothetical protein